MCKRVLTFVVLLGFAITARAQFDQTGTTTVSVTVSAESAIQVNTAVTTLTAAPLFSPFTGTTSYTYKIRSSPSTGSGSITLQITSDFAPAGGPSVGSPPTPGDALTYTCTVAAPGTACAGTQTASTTVATNVATFGADAHSSASGNAGSLAWSLTNDPAYQTGTYSATATFTISST